MSCSRIRAACAASCCRDVRERRDSGDQQDKREFGECSYRFLHAIHCTVPRIDGAIALSVQVDVQIEMKLPCRAERGGLPSIRENSCSHSAGLDARGIPRRYRSRPAGCSLKGEMSAPRILTARLASAPRRAVGAVLPTPGSRICSRGSGSGGLNRPCSQFRFAAKGTAHPRAAARSCRARRTHLPYRGRTAGSGLPGCP